jgi:hypothetical protein
MTTQDFFALATQLFGPQCIERSHPARDIRFRNDSSISVDLVSGIWRVVEPGGKERVEVDGKAVLLLGGSLKEVSEALKKQNGSKDWREALARQTIAEIEARETKEPRLPKITDPEILERARERVKARRAKQSKKSGRRS